MNLGAAQVIQGNALALSLPDNSVDLICTSPPYFGLRSYQDGGQHYDGQIGSEATPQEFLDALMAATREMVRVLKPSGSIFVNLGDKYAGKANDRVRWGTGNLDNGQNSTFHDRLASAQKLNTSYGNIRDKSLMGIPWRYAIRCIDELGLILRAEIIWAKPNGLPESVTDRVRRSHENWFHFVKQPRYFSAVDEIREEHLQPDRVRADVFGGKTAANGVRHAGATTYTGPTNALGKLPGSVWSIPAQPLTVPPELGVDHFAAYPMEWPRRIIQGFTPNGICTECGEGRRPISTTEYVNDRQNKRFAANSGLLTGRHRSASLSDGPGATTIIGYFCGCTQIWWCTNCRKPLDGNPPFCPDCGSSAGFQDLPPTTPAVVLDPFGGTGTTALIAKALGRTGITIDLSRDYCRLAEWRCNDPGQLAAALQIEKPEPVHPDQLDLFEGEPA